MTDWEDMDERERLAAKLTDAGPSKEVATAWVREVIDQAIAEVLADLRAKVEALPDEHHYGARRGGCISRDAVLNLIDGSNDAR